MMCNYFMFGFVLFFISNLSAQSSRTWVSGTGNDMNACSRSLPCKTFSGAYLQTATPGEIDAVDSGDFGIITINHSVTIDGGEGQIAGIEVSSGSAITITAGSNDVIILRNLEINGLNSGVYGIQFNSGGTLIIENCKIYGFTNAIYWSSSLGGNLIVRNSTITNNYNGVVVLPISNSNILNVSVSNSLFSENAGTSIWGYTNHTSSLIFIDVENCVLTQNLWGVSAASAGVTVNCANNTFSRNSGGAIINGGGLIYLTANQIENNNYGALSSGGPIYSFGNNAISGNVSSSPLTSLSLQ